ncbi:MAG: hypothetical protein V2I33_08325 [Kangiellaceae bacterium]|nr:hypothetical protein [Kangiellaceae bacterium]
MKLTTLIASLVICLSAYASEFEGFLSVQYKDAKNQSYVFGDKVSLNQGSEISIPLYSFVDDKRVQLDNRLLLVTIINHTNDFYEMNFKWVNYSSKKTHIEYEKVHKGILNGNSQFDLPLLNQTLIVSTVIDKKFTLEEIKKRFENKQ